MRQRELRCADERFVRFFQAAADCPPWRILATAAQKI
jgi:hypothetical protein